jgi:uncharacterized membrane protein
MNEHNHFVHSSGRQFRYIIIELAAVFAIDHRTWKTGLPVRSVVLKPCAGRLVVGWVTTSEYLLLIVFWTFLRPKVHSVESLDS